MRAEQWMNNNTRQHDASDKTRPNTHQKTSTDSQTALVENKSKADR